jgi:hypothetical protein
MEGVCMSKYEHHYKTVLLKQNRQILTLHPSTNSLIKFHRPGGLKHMG